MNPNTQTLKQLQVASPDIFSDEELYALRRSDYAFVPVKPLRCVIIKQKHVQGHFQEELTGSWSYHFTTTRSTKGTDVFQMHGSAETLSQAIWAVEGALRGAGFDPELPERAPTPSAASETPRLEVVPAADLLQ